MILTSHLSTIIERDLTHYIYILNEILNEHPEQPICIEIQGLLTASHLPTTRGVAILIIQMFFSVIL